MGDYVPQPKPALHEETFTAELGTYGKWSVRMTTRFAVYRGQVRDFAISLWVLASGEQFEIEAVDCCHGQLHRHRMYSSDPYDRQADKALIRELHRGDEAIVDIEYDVQYRWMGNNWESLVRRWNDG
ncbi:hypothetical protein [Nocardia wallacei]|uniref:hypothetical protein n=1 Tax=Nocardia wallacei TaxID=480035 RepID=UPI002454E6C1|nr:hypothetical protein [Nocardia wallacei]